MAKDAKEFTVHELAEFAPLRKTDHETVRVRVVRYGDDARYYVDVRKYVVTKRYTGWSSGIGMTPEGFAALMDQGEQIRAVVATLTQAAA